MRKSRKEIHGVCPQKFLAAWRGCGWVGGGTLVAAGLIAGEGITGIVLAVLALLA